MNEEINLEIENNNQTQKKTHRLTRLQLYFLYFLIFSFIGWILETFYSLYELGHFTNRGFLYGPLCPIYGWGALILMIFFNKYKKHSFKLFICAAIVFSIFEYVVSYGMDALFATKWWDYSNEFFNLNGRISIFYSIMWGIAAILFVNHIFPFFKKKINILLSKVPYNLQKITLFLAFFILVLDTCISFVHNLI